MTWPSETAATSCYYELMTTFHAVSLLDEATVRNADVLSLELAGEGEGSLPADERNLAWQAAELMAEHVGRAPDVAITTRSRSRSRAGWRAAAPTPRRSWSR